MFQDLYNSLPAFILIPQLVAHADSFQGKIDIAGAKAEFAAGNNAGKYRDAITDEDILKKLDALDPLLQLVVAQSFYEVGDMAGCKKCIKNAPASRRAPPAPTAEGLYPGR